MDRIAPRNAEFASRRKTSVRAAVYACAVILPAMVAGPGRAQSAPPPPLDPRQPEKSFERFETEQRRAKQAPVPVPRLERPKISSDTRPLIALKAVSVEGASAISPDAMADIYEPYIGKTVSQADLAAISIKIGDRYREAGYHLSRAIVPPQDIKRGRVRIQVIEGQIAEVALKGDGAEQFGIRSLLDPVVAEQPSQLTTLERQLLLNHDRPGVRIADTVLEEIGEATGRFRLILYVKTARINAAVGASNAGTPPIGPLQAYFATGFNSTVFAGDSFGVNLATVPNHTSELRFGRLLYDTPIGVNSVRLGATAAYGDTRPGDERRLVNTNIKSETFELRASVDPLQTRKSALRVTVAVDYNDVAERDLLGTNYSDHVRTLELRTDYRLNDDMDGVNYLNATLRQGLDVLGASRRGDDTTSNSDSPSNFTLVNFSATRIQKLNDIISLKVSAIGQFTSATLLTSQKFYLGGPAFGRGYFSGDLSGDNGIAGSLELRFDKQLNDEFLKGYQLYGFVDRGTVWDRFASDERSSLSSAGGGVRLYFADAFQADISVGVPLDYRSPYNVNRDPRYLFSVSKSFDLCPDRTEMRCF
jgi:hemolysin activation/secretion protein